MGCEKNSNQAKVLVLGTYHFASSGGHAIDFEVSDVMSNKKQEEILAVVNNLTEFNPNKIAVESPIASSEELNTRYLEYCSGRYSLDKNEIEQIGFRLAKVLNHNRIYAIDVQASLPFDPIAEYAQKNMPELWECFQQEIIELTRINEQLHKGATVSEALKYYNDPERNAIEHSDLYLTLTQIGTGDTYCGADFISAWYDRNIRIFANLQSIAKPKDRILVLYGAGHSKILCDFISSYKKMELIDTAQYL